MKNPFQKEDHTGLYIGVAIGAAAGITLGWLYLTDRAHNIAVRSAER